MPSTFTVDASVFLNAFNPYEEGHSDSQRLLAWMQDQALPIIFENGVGLQVESFWASHQPNRLQIELFDTNAGAQLRPIKLYKTVNNAPRDKVNLPKGPKPWDNIAEHLIACILDGIECQAPLRHGLIVQGMMEALLESAETRREVRLCGCAVGQLSVLTDARLFSSPSCRII